MPEVFVSIGSCIRREENVITAVTALQSRFGRIRLSSVYETEAVGFAGQPFYNLVVSFKSNDTPMQLKKYFREIEYRQGRSRDVEMPGPCPLDIDLLLYGDLIVETNDLKLPREDVLKHAYVLEPLAELAPYHCYPGTRQHYLDLWFAHYQKHQSKALSRLHWNPLSKPAVSYRGWCFPDYTLGLSSCSTTARHS